VLAKKPRQGPRYITVADESELQADDCTG
jgi:hypothetical protein